MGGKNWLTFKMFAPKSDSNQGEAPDGLNLVKRSAE